MVKAKDSKNPLLLSGGLLLCMLSSLFLFISCGIFTSSAFPENLNYIADSKDLNGELGSFLGGRKISEVKYQFYILQDSNGRDYLFLMILLEDTGESRLLILDQDLKIKSVRSNGSFWGMFAFYHQNSIWVPSGHEFVIGREVYDGDSLEYAGDIDSPGFPIGGGGVVPDFGTIGFGAMGRIYWMYRDDGLGEFRIESDDDNWDNFSSFSNGGIERAPRKLVHDRATGEVAVFFFNESGDGVSACRYPEYQFPDLISYWPVFPYDSDFNTSNGSLDFSEIGNPNDIHYTREGIIVTREDNDLVRYGFAGDEEDDLQVGGQGDKYFFAFDVAGNYFYSFCFNERRMYKMITWWE